MVIPKSETLWVYEEEKLKNAELKKLSRDTHPILIQNAQGEIRIYGKNKNSKEWKSIALNQNKFLTLAFPKSNEDAFLADESLITPEMYKEIESKSAHTHTYEASTLKINVGDRNLAIYNPSDRYVYDYGTEDALLQLISDQLSQGENPLAPWLDGQDKEKNNIKRQSKGIKESEFTPLEPGDVVNPDAILNTEYAGYRELAKDVNKLTLPDKELVTAMRKLLKGWKPIDQDLLNMAENEDEQHNATYGRDSLLNQISDLFPLLVVALFACEPARNPACFATGLMLLDLVALLVALN